MKNKWIKNKFQFYYERSITSVKLKKENTISIINKSYEHDTIMINKFLLTIPKFKKQNMHKFLI